MSDLLIVIGNKRYSSWSMRPWIALKHLGLPFREHHILLNKPTTAAEIAKVSGAGRVPVLVDGGVTVHESLAILEYVNEVHAGGKMLPAKAADRAVCRAVSSEMHAGFGSLREQCPMDLGRKPAPVPHSEQTRADIRRILSLWESLRERHREAGPYLFGALSIADCMFLPVATRFATYEVDLTSHPRARAYLDALLTLPAFLAWKRDALAETDVLTL